MLEFLNLEPESFGLDINDSSFKIIKLKKRHGFLRPVSFNEKEIPQGIVNDGIIQDEDAFVKNLKEALSSVKGEKLKTKYVVCSLPEEKSFSQVIQMPKMEMEELKSAVPFEAENYIPLPANQMYLGFRKIISDADHLDHLDILIVAIEKTLVDSYLACLKKAGLMPLALEVETQSIARALIKSKTSLAPVALIDFGSDTTDFIVYSGRSVRFTSSISTSSEQVTKAISEELGISSKEAEHMKVKYGLESEGPSHRAKAVSKAVKPVLYELIAGIQKYLDYYSGHDFHEHLAKDNSKKNKIEKIILSGGGANLKGINKFLSEKISMPVEFGNPLINFPNIKKGVLPEFQKNYLSFATAIGLALRGYDNE
ncbi:MAG: type IV pilus assembly protein PilM [Candidatus Staskawiczbacteria bacterium]|nr:type IV pilus assembly protein PilM [Candidatus Staskawiczbacteria bacterium]